MEKDILLDELNDLNSTECVPSAGEQEGSYGDEAAQNLQLNYKEHAANNLPNKAAVLEDLREQDVEDEIFRNVIRRQAVESNNADDLPKPLEGIPMLLQDIKRLDVRECSERGGIYHAFDKKIRFRTLIVWARIVTPLKTIGNNNNKLLSFDVDDGTARMSVSFFKNNYSINALQALRQRLHHEHDDNMMMVQCMEKLLYETERLLDYDRLQQNQWILILGQPGCFHTNININAFAMLADTDFKCNITDFEIAFKSKLIKWYINNVPRCRQNK